jgi:hypothetical protein
MNDSGVLRVYKETDIVIFMSIPYPLPKYYGARILEVMLKNANRWIKSEDIKIMAYLPEDFRVDKLLKRFPHQISKFIKSKKGKGGGYFFSPPPSPTQ